MMGVNLLVAPPATAVDDVGYVDFAYGSGVSAPTGDKPQSKLWIAGGTWWGSMFDPVSKDFHIYRLSSDLRTWTDTGVLIDERASSHMDTLWDESTNKLYVVTAGHNETNTSHSPRVLRFSYTGGVWSRDAGFPVEIGTGGTEAVTIARDSTGILWVAYAQGAKVYTQHTTTDDQTWTQKVKLPTDESSVSTDDLAAIISFDDNKIGVLWSNQRTNAMMFASHVDGTGDDQWTTEVAYVRPPEGADDHINLKSLQADPAGRVLAAVKTSLNESDDPLIHLLVLGLDGTWSSHMFGTAAQQHTRAIVQVDTENRVVYMFASAPCCSGGIIYMKSLPLDDLSADPPIDFPAGMGTPVIASAANPKINNPTSTKQGVTSATGLVVLAGDDSTRRYLHAGLALTPSATAPPDTTITSGPTSPTGDSDASFEFTSTKSGSTFTCALDGATAEPCQSPVALTGLGLGGHTFTVTATDASGNPDPTPASWEWTIEVDTAPPDTSITSGPAHLTGDTGASFEFASSESGSTFACSLDGATAEPCQSPVSLTGLGLGAHTFTVTATDAAGNPDPTPASWEWTIEVAPPLFTDDFESGGLTTGEWVAATGGTGSVAVTPASGFGPSYGLQITSTSQKGAFAYAQKSLPPGATLTLSVDLRVLSETRSGRKHVLKVYAGTTRILTLERANGVGTLGVVDAANTMTTASGTQPVGAWSRLQIRLTVGSTDHVTVWKDGDR